MNFIQYLKSVAKRIFPPSSLRFDQEIKSLQKQISENQKQTTQLLDGLKQLDKNMLQYSLLTKENQDAIHLLSQESKSFYKQIMTDKTELINQNQENSCSLQKIAELLSPLNELLINSQKGVRQRDLLSRSIEEVLWAEIFNNTISDSLWLKDKAFSPGRWAVGYPFLYAMYRILCATHPKRILELGMGQTTKMLSQFAQVSNAEHIVVENDQDWIHFFLKHNPLSCNSKVVCLEREMTAYKEVTSIRAFKNFKETFKDQKFDFISIDAPLGADMTQYARIDILSLIPECLTDKFVILIDDCERKGEMNTIEEIKTTLSSNGISYATGRFNGKKDCMVLAADSVKFVTTT